MDTLHAATPSERYARCIDASKRVRWDIDRDVLRGRSLDHAMKFLPDRLSKVGELECLSAAERRLLSQIQGRTYANMIALFERAIGAKVLQLSRDHWFGDQTALEALVRFTDEELKHQALFRRIEGMMAAGMPSGYDFVAEPNDVAREILGRSTWAVLALTCHVELFTQAHYRQSIDPDPELSPLWKDVLLFHWKEEAQHAVIDELEWRRENAGLTAFERDAALGDLLDLIGVLDGLVREQARADTGYFLRCCGRVVSPREVEQIGALILKAYRWQYITSGIQDERLGGNLADMLTDAQMQRLDVALRPLIG